MQRQLGLLLVLMISWCVAGSQTLTDTSFVLGRLKEPGAIYREKGEYCSGAVPKYLAATPPMVVAGFDTCSSSFSSTVLYDVIYKGEHFYVDTANLTLERFSFNDLNALGDARRAAFARHAERDEKVYYSVQKGQLDDLQFKLRRTGIMLLEWSINNANSYSTGTDVHFTVSNIGRKEIKYIFFYVKGYTTRGRKIVSELKNTSVMELRGMGPVPPGSQQTFTFNNAWPSKSVGDAKITSLRITYSDGSNREISDVEKLMLSPALYAYLFSDTQVE